MNNSWYDEFSAYDIDNLGKKDDTTVITEDPVAQGAESVKPVLDVNTIPKETTPITEASAPKQPTPDTPIDDDDIEVTPWWLDERISIKDTPNAKPLTKEDLELMATQQESAANTATELLQQTHQIMKNASGKRMPRGLRTIAILLRDICSILTATKALIDTYINIGVEPLFQTIKQNRLKSAAAITVNTLNAHAGTMCEGFTELTTMMTETNDRPSLNLRTCIIKGQVTAIYTFAQEQSKTFLDTLNAFPLKDGALLLLALLCSEHDDNVQIAIDDCLRVAEAPLPLCADALTMLKAIQKKEERTICSLIRKTAEERSKRQQINE